MEQSIYTEVERFTAFLHENEKADGTIEKYIRDVRMFTGGLGQETLCKEKVIEWKESLVENGYEPVTINSMLSSLNSFFKFHGRTDCCVKFLKIQRKLYRSEEKELTKDEYGGTCPCRKNTLVEAGAGTGKTFSMVSRVAFLCNKKVGAVANIADEIAMVTFTNDMLQSLSTLCLHL